MKQIEKTRRQKFDANFDVERRRKIAIALTIFLFAFCVRLYYLDKLAMKNHIRGDVVRYMGYAVNLIQNGVYSQD